MTVVARINGVVIFAVVVLSIPYVNNRLAPLFLNSRFDRLGEKKLPKPVLEGNIMCCRMKADDFRFPLPPGSDVENPVVTGGFDTAKGSLLVRFDNTQRMSESRYGVFLGKVQTGGNVRMHTVPEGLLITFDYFGDK